MDFKTRIKSGFKKGGLMIKQAAKHKITEIIEEKKSERQAYKDELHRLKIVDAKGRARAKINKGREKARAKMKRKKERSQDLFSGNGSGGFI